MQKTDIDLSVIDVNSDFTKALKAIESDNKNLFITGKAGTGKSTLLKYFRQTTQKKVAVLAPTGVAAINAGGQTIHSFFRLAPKIIKPAQIKPLENPSLIKKIDTIIIDEISMVRADVMDGIDRSLRINRKKRKIPFGGVQMVFFGDLFQLPPVVRGRELHDYFNTLYGGPYFFCSKVFKDIPVECLDLKKVYRQTDNDFIRILNSIRENNIESSVLDALNCRVLSPKETIKPDEYITLTTTNNTAYRINEHFLNRIKAKEFFYEADIEGRLNESDYPTEEILQLKKGARVMLLKNDRDRRWVNGTIGTIKSLKKDKIVVDIDGESCTVDQEKWEKIQYTFNRDENRIEERIIGSFTQFPLRLAWAITIHKSQGQTFEKVLIDLTSGVFAHGQTYVALSRCTSLSGIKLKIPLTARDIIFDPKVHEYSKHFNR